jgi:hypothetical protein
MTHDNDYIKIGPITMKHYPNYKNDKLNIYILQAFLNSDKRYKRINIKNIHKIISSIENIDEYGYFKGYKLPDISNYIYKYNLLAITYSLNNSIEDSLYKNKRISYRIMYKKYKCYLKSIFNKDNYLLTYMQFKKYLKIDKNNFIIKTIFTKNKGDNNNEKDI